MRYEVLIAFLFGLALGMFLVSRLTVRHPLADHQSYMLAEIPNLMLDIDAFVTVEERIDEFLLALENKE